MLSRRVLAALLAGLFGAILAVPVPVGAQGNRDLDILVTDAAGTPLPDASVTLGTTTATTDYLGRARLADVSAGMIIADHQRFAARTHVWDGTGDRVRFSLGSPVLRGIHVAGTLPGTTRWDALLVLAERTSVNAFMLDMKDESGRVFPHTASLVAHASGAAVGLWDLAAVVDELHGEGLSVILRIVTFQDPITGNAMPEMAVQSGGGPFTRRGLTFLDPTDPDARAYGLVLAAEACAAGVDEVQFDYVRFPEADHSVLSFDGPVEEADRNETIRSFLADAKAAAPPGCAIAADIFGFVTSVPGDGGIGQNIETVAAVADVLSPMAYPNHWSRGWFGYDTPADHPGGVVDASMRDALGRVGGQTTIRPWLQDFGGYGPAEVRAQIDAADALGLGWMLWNAGSEFTEAGIPTDREIRTPDVVAAPETQTLPLSGYWDVHDGTTFSAHVRWLGEQGITRGCNPPWRDQFCPRRTLTRAEAATFLVRALELPPSDVDRFTDDDGTTHEDSINALAAAGITRGCRSSSYCPHQPLTRAQMASLIARALALDSVDRDTFSDDDGSTHEADIERIAAVGITVGCARDRFCPSQPVSREQAAAFLHRALT